MSWNYCKSRDCGRRRVSSEDFCWYHKRNLTSVKYPLFNGSIIEQRLADAYEQGYQAGKLHQKVLHKNQEK